MKLMQAKKQSSAGTKRLADGKKRPLPCWHRKSGKPKHIACIIAGEKEIVNEEV